MQVIKKEKQLVEKEVIVENYSLCDKCDQRIVTQNYDAFECEFTHKTGKTYPEAGHGELEEIELCQTCSAELVALLIEKGYRINRSKWDWDL